MSKRKKDDLYESKWEVFLRNYRTVPGFKALVKLFGYFIFFLVFILILSFGTSSSNEERNNSNSNEQSTQPNEFSKTYKDILSDLATNNSKIEVLHTIDTNKTKINASFENQILTGTIESEIGIKRFKISGSEIYEVLLDKETINPSIFGTLNTEFLIPSSLVRILNENQATKRIEEGKVLYNYAINYQDIKYNINVTVTKEAITGVDISNENEVYSLKYTDSKNQVE